MFGLFGKKKSKALTGAELAEEGLTQIAIAIAGRKITLEPGRIFDDVYVHADAPQGVRRTSYVMFSPTVENEVIAKCSIIHVGAHDGTPKFQIDWAVHPLYRRKNWGKSIAAKALKEFTTGMAGRLPTGFLIEAVVDEDNAPSKTIARTLIGDEMILFNEQTSAKVCSYVKSFR